MLNNNGLLRIVKNQNRKAVDNDVDSYFCIN